MGPVSTLSFHLTSFHFPHSFFLGHRAKGTKKEKKIKKTKPKQEDMDTTGVFQTSFRSKVNTKEDSLLFTFTLFNQTHDCSPFV